MGQAASNASKRVASAVVAPRTTTQTIQQSVEHQVQQRATNAASTIVGGASSSSAPSSAASAASAPATHSADARQQQQLLQRQQYRTTNTTTNNDDGGGFNATVVARPDDGAGADAGFPEMPQDLINFLNDAGPLTRSIDKELTSPKVYDMLAHDEQMRTDQAKQANLRVRRRMQLVGTADNNSPVSGSVGGDNSNNNNNKNVNTATSLEATNDYIDDGTTTTRTTNFSTVDRSDLRMGFGVTREDLFRIASKNIPFHDDATNDDSQWKMEMKKEFQTIVSAARGEEGSTSTNEFKSDAQEEEDLALLENSLKYIGVPVLMKDADGDILGTWAHKADEMRFSGLKIVPEGSLQFAFERESRSSSSSN